MEKLLLLTHRYLNGYSSSEVRSPCPQGNPASYMSLKY